MYLGPKDFRTEDHLLDYLLDNSFPTISCDVETVSLKDRSLIGIGIGLNQQESVYFRVLFDPCMYLNLCWQLLDKSSTVIFHNGIFDLTVLLEYFNRMYDQQPWGVKHASMDTNKPAIGRYKVPDLVLAVANKAADTSLMGQMQGLPSLELANMASTFVGMQIQRISDILPKEHDMLDLPWGSAVGLKCLYDCLATIRLYWQMEGPQWSGTCSFTWSHPDNYEVGFDPGEPNPLWVSEGMLDCYQVGVQLMPILLHMTARGFALHHDKIEYWYEKLSQELLTHADVCTAEGFNPGSPQQVGYTLAARGNFLPFTKSRKQLNTSEEVLEELDDPLAQTVLQYRGVQKARGTYIIPYRDEYRAYTHYRMDLSTSRLACITPSTKVLTKDLEWVEAGQLKTGDLLLAFDEKSYGRKDRRCWKESEILQYKVEDRPTYRVKTSHGSLEVTGEHQWLVQGGGRGSSYVGQGYQWVETRNLNQRPDLGPTKVARMLDPWDNNLIFSREAGYVGGFLDGEGTVYQRPHPNTTTYGLQVGAVQVPNSGWDEFLRCLDYLGIQGQVKKRPLNHRNSNWQDQEYWYTNKFSNAIKTLAISRPLRLLDKLDLNLKRIAKALRFEEVLSIEYIGTQPVVVMGTSTRTYVAEGYAAHNSYDRNTMNIPSYLREILMSDSGEWSWIDWSQIEMRIMAEVSQDATMLQAYADGEDIHWITQQKLWPGSSRDDDAARLPSKTFNFSMLYRAQARTMSRKTKLPLPVTTEYRDVWLFTYAGVDLWQRKAIEDGWNNKWAETMYGRRCRLPSLDYAPVAHYEKCAVNYPIQGTGFDILARGMLICWRLGMDLALPLHDELLVDGKAEWPEQLSNLGKLHTPFKHDRGPYWH